MHHRIRACALGILTLSLNACVAEVDEPIALDAPDEQTGTAEEALATYTIMDASTPFFIPPHVGGDREFKGHGPVVNLEVNLEIRNQTELWARVYMRAIETKRDWTEARGHDYFLLYRSSRPIKGIVGPRTFEHEYIDSDHGHDYFSFSSNVLVKTLDYVGDTKGSEAGTRTGVRVYFNPITIRFD